MTAYTVVQLTDRLPLTCSRSGTCCHGKMVWLNPWELAHLARAANCSPQEFREQFCEFGGIRLRFNGPAGWKGLPACSQYDSARGCRVHAGRPLACRLYPLGRQLQGENEQYIFTGKQFPCLAGCAEVVDLPHMSVQDYLDGQNIIAAKHAQDEYLHLMQRLADGAFVLLIESGLARTGDKKTLRGWRKIGSMHPQERCDSIQPEWMTRLMVPELTWNDDPIIFAKQHYDLLQQHAQNTFAALNTPAALSEASQIMMTLALHVAQGLGSDPEQLADRWIHEAKKHGAQE
jgi:uncharacterized protein